MQRCVAIVVLIGGLAVSPSWGQDARTVVKDGVTYQETVTKQQYPVTELKSQTRTEKRTQVKPEQQKVTQLVWVAITEYQLEPVQKSSWNPFASPTWEYQYVPHTRWEQKTQEVTVTVMKQETLDVQITEQVPVTRWVEGERKTLVAVNGSGAHGPASTVPMTASLSRPNGASSSTTASTAPATLPSVSTAATPWNPPASSAIDRTRK